jgi:hypothetical protein
MFRHSAVACARVKPLWNPIYVLLLSYETLAQRAARYFFYERDKDLLVACLPSQPYVNGMPIKPAVLARSACMRG